MHNQCKNVLTIKNSTMIMHHFQSRLKNWVGIATVGSLKFLAEHPLVWARCKPFHDQKNGEGTLQSSWTTPRRGVKPEKLSLWPFRAGHSTIIMHRASCVDISAECIHAVKCSHNHRAPLPPVQACCKRSHNQKKGWPPLRPATGHGHCLASSRVAKNQTKPV